MVSAWCPLLGTSNIIEISVCLVKVKVPADYKPVDIVLHTCGVSFRLRIADQE